MKATILGLLTLAVCFGVPAQQIYDTNNPVVSTFAGSGFTGYLNGTGAQTMWSSPTAIVADSNGNLFVWDSGNVVLRKIGPDGTVSTFAGGGTQFEGYGTNVAFTSQGFQYVTMDHSGTIWTIALYGSYYYLISISTNAEVQLQNANISNLSLSSSLCVDSQNNIYYTGGNRIYRYTPSSLTSQAFVGSGNSGQQDGQGIFCSFSGLGAMTIDQADNIYVQDSGLIRRIDSSANVSTLAGGGSGDGYARSASASANGMWADNQGNVYLAGSTWVRRMSAETNITTVAGTFTGPASGYTNGPGDLARFYGANNICGSQGCLFVTDTQNQRIRQISFNPQSQIVPPSNLSVATYLGVTINGTVGRIYQIQSSPDMNSWTTATTVLLNSTPYLWIDQSGAPKKFYRAVMLP